MALVYDFPLVWCFVSAANPGLARADGMRGLGEVDVAGEVRAGVVVEGINRFHCWLHVAVRPGVAVSRRLVVAVFLYVFQVLGCAQTRAYVDASNVRSRQLCERLGFRVDATLDGAAQDGGDVIVFAMRRSECRYLEN